MDPETAHLNLKDLQIVDVRQDNEFAGGHIEGSVNIPLRQLPGRIEEIDPARRTLVVCQIGQRSDMGARFLRSQGIDAHNLDGGVERWTRQGYTLAGDHGAPGRVVDGWAEILED